MLRAKTLALLASILVIALCSSFYTRTTQQTLVARRVTNTAESAINLNPTLSDDGSTVIFESTVDLAQSGGSPSFRCVAARLFESSASFVEIARTRCISPALSRDGSQVVFASTEDLLGRNSDRNSEIYLSNGVDLQQITSTTPSTPTSRLIDGNFQPSVSEDGRFIAFSSNRDLIGHNADHNFEIFLFDRFTGLTAQLTATFEPLNFTSPKISGDGKRIVFKSNSVNGGGDLMLYERINEALRPLLTQLDGLTLSEGRAINHDGARVIYVADTGKDQSQVFLYDISQSTSQQLTTLGSRSNDVKLNPSISSDGKRVAFATRRRVGNAVDGSVELYVYDIPSRQIQQITNAPSAASAEVVSSMNFDGSVVAFNFPRVLDESVNDTDSLNNSEIYVANVSPRPPFGIATAVNGASASNDSATDKTLAPDSIVIIRGSALAMRNAEATFVQQQLPFNLAGTWASIGGLAARMLYASPDEVVLVLPPTLPEGPAEIVLTNGDGFTSRAAVMIKRSSPGIFTFSGDGRGKGVIINADNFISEPLDPTAGNLRLVAFGTGLRFASNVSAKINGEALTVESIRPSSVPGLDEIRLLIPTSLRGEGLATLRIVADGRQSNPVTVSLAGSSLRDIMINEFLGDPPDGLDGDANRDGVRSASADEFVELVNATTHDINLGGYQLVTPGNSGETVRHKFSAETLLPAGTALVVFGGGNPNPTNSMFGGAQVLKASSGALSLINTSGSIILRDDTGSLVSSVNYGSGTAVEGVNNQSITRSPDINGVLAAHQEASKSGARFSPGTQVDGNPFVPNPAVALVQVNPTSLELRPREKFQLNARAIDAGNQVMDGVLFKWQSSDPKVAAVDLNGLLTALVPGTTQIIATARGVSSVAVLLVVQPSPSPSPTTSPTPSPSPTTTPVALPPLVIGEFRTRGPAGANDEFIEIYNVSNVAIDIGGLKLRASNGSGSIGTRLTINPGTTIPAHGHFLATNSSGYSGPVQPDQSFSSGITNDGGMALTLADDRVIDQVGLSAGSSFKEGMHLAPLASDANQSYERRPGGTEGSSVDTGQNFDDFKLATPSDPQNLKSPATPGSSASPSPTPTTSPTITPAPTPMPPASPSPSPTTNIAVVISQVYGGGGNSGAPYRNDFIEIFNRGDTTIDLSGWSIQYAGATSATWSITNLTTVSLAPGQFYLIQEASGGPTGIALPASDVSGSIAMSASAGKVALVKTQTPLSGTCPIDSNIVDLVGYGNVTCFRGSGPTPVPGNASAALRKTNGCTDSGNNANDFQIGLPNPRNTLAVSTPCLQRAR